MSNYRKIAEQALLKSLNRNKPMLNEGVVYGDNISERMHPQLEKELAPGQTATKNTNIQLSLGYRF